jgi:hypothetical protein
MSEAQDARHAIYAVLFPRWSATLTEAQRTAWRSFAPGYPRTDALGQNYAPSGHNAFISAIAISYAYAGSFINNPPAGLFCHQPTALEILTATASPQALDIRMYGTLTADEYWVLGATPTTTAGTYNVRALWRPLAFGQNALPYTHDAAAEYFAKFDELISTKKVAVRFQIANVATGTISIGISTSLEVAA